MTATARSSRTARASGSKARRSDSGDTETEQETPLQRGVTLAAAVGALYVFLGFLIGSRVITDNSFFTHFANGRLIWNGAGIPRFDPFSFSAAGEPVTVQSWLPSWVYVGLHQTFGGWSLRLLNGVLGALLVGSLWRLSEPAKQLLPRVALVGAAIVVGAGLWTPRPLLFGLLGFSAALHVLRRDLPAWTLIPVMWVWVNSHGSFPIAFALVGLVGLGQALDTLIERRRELGLRPRVVLRDAVPWHELRVFGWVTLGTALGALNPLGPKLLWFPISLLSRSEALENVAEWQSPTFKRPYEWGFVVLALAMLYTLRRRPALRSLLPGLVFIGAALLAYRNLPLASIVLVSCAAPHFSDTRLMLDGASRGTVPRALRAIAVGGMALVAVVAVQQGAFDFRKYPVAEIDWLEERDLVANPEVHLIQRDTVGNYLEIRYGTEAQVFMDDRFDFYPLPVLRDHDSLIFGGDYAAVLDEYDADVVLWGADDGFADWLREAPDWAIAYEEDELERWIVACRVGSSAAERCA